MSVNCKPNMPKGYFDGIHTLNQNQIYINNFQILSIAKTLQSSIINFLKSYDNCSVMLTGGRSAAILYRAWSSILTKDLISKINFYFTDERCVPFDHIESNYSMVMNNLFNNYSPEFLKVYRMDACNSNLENAANEYAALLPNNIDIMILSLGEDGHIASLFPNSSALFDARHFVTPVIGPKAPFKRLTISPSVIKNAREVFVLALGAQKRAVYEEALRNPIDINSIPARLVLNRTWIFGE